MARMSYILLSAVSILVWTIVSAKPLPEASTDEREERLLNEIQQLRLIHDLENQLSNVIEHQDESDGAKERIIEEIGQLRLLQEWQLSNDVDSPSNQVKVLEEHSNIPTDAIPSDGDGVAIIDSDPLELQLEVLEEHFNTPTDATDDDDTTIIDSDSLELQLFDAGTDDQGNRIYTANSEIDHLEEELQNLEKESGADASEDEINDLVQQLESLSHLRVPEKSSGTVAPTEMPSTDILSDGEISGETSADELSEETSTEASSGENSSGDSSGEYSSEESSSDEDGSGDVSGDVSGDGPSNDADSHLIVSFTEEGSGIYDDEKLALEAESLSLVADGNAVAVVEEESSGTEMSGDGIFGTEEPDAFFSYTEIITEIVEVEYDITTMAQTPEPLKEVITRPAQKTTMEPASSTTEIVPTTKKSVPTTKENALLTTEVASYCLESQFECVSNHHCIPHSMVCDTIPDCEDRSDENQDMCIPERQCNTGYFKCGNSPHCVEENNRCDGIYHCYNGEDEKNCLSCVDLHGHPKTLNPEDFCDGTQDCIDNMDEDAQRCAAPCVPGYHRCDDGLQCIKEDLVCNGIHNCHDKSDEKQCARDMLDCWTYNMFACDGICLPQSALCDYSQDCMDNIDEKGCTFKPKTCPKAFIYQPETDSCLHTSLIFSEPYDLLQILDQTQDREKELQYLEDNKLIM